MAEVKNGMRADIYLHTRGYCESRSRASSDIKSGCLYVNGKNIKKNSFEISDGDTVELRGRSTVYVGRGGDKLEKALTEFCIDIKGTVCADIGASTGGFTDCLLRHGAVKVYAVDCGCGQLHPSLRSDPRVKNIEKFNARLLTPDTFGEKCDVAVMDVSFISQTAIIPAVVRVLKDGGKLITLIKPQFECGKEHIGKNGIVRKAEYRAEAVSKVLSAASDHGLSQEGLCESPIKGGDGNTEFLAYFVMRRKIPDGLEKVGEISLENGPER